jgi:hypothetical protein
VEQAPSSACLLLRSIPPPSQRVHLRSLCVLTVSDDHVMLAEPSREPIARRGEDERRRSSADRLANSPVESSSSSWYAPSRRHTYPTGARQARGEGVYSLSWNYQSVSGAFGDELEPARRKSERSWRERSKPAAKQVEGKCQHTSAGIQESIVPSRRSRSGRCEVHQEGRKHSRCCRTNCFPVDRECCCWARLDAGERGLLASRLWD